jgi:hypothetical protein
VAAKTLYEPGTASLSSLTMIERVCSNLRNVLGQLEYSFDNLHRSLEAIGKIYAMIDAHQNRALVQQDKLRFPVPGRRELAGMEIQFR